MDQPSRRTIIYHLIVLDIRFFLPRTTASYLIYMMLCLLRIIKTLTSLSQSDDPPLAQSKSQPFHPEAGKIPPLFHQSIAPTGIEFALLVRRICLQPIPYCQLLQTQPRLSNAEDRHIWSLRRWLEAFGWEEESAVVWKLAYGVRDLFAATSGQRPDGVDGVEEDILGEREYD